MEYWTKQSFMALGNALGFFMDVDMSFLETREMAIAKILVSLEMKEGLFKELEFISREKYLK
jgi:hypothetical protein